MTGRMIICKIVDSLNRTESLYHGLKVSPGSRIRRLFGRVYDILQACVLNQVHPTCTERPSLIKECGWKGGDRGGLAQWEQSGKRRNKEVERKSKKRLDTRRPSHGRT